MPNEEISQIQLPNGDVYDIRDGNVSDFKTNIDEETLSDGQILKYNEDAGEWENSENDLELLKTASGSIATFTDGGDDIPVKSFECEIVAQQASGTPTPANPLSITGFSQAGIGNISDATNITYFKGVLEGKYGFVNLGSLAYGTGTGGNARFTANLPSIPIVPSSASQIADIISDIYETTTSTDIYSGSGNYQVAIHTNGLLWIRNTDYSDTNAFKTAMNGHYIIYKLETPVTPVTPTITPEQFKSLCEAFGITSDMFIVEFGQTIYGGRLIYSNDSWAIEATYNIADMGDLTWTYRSTEMVFYCEPTTNCLLNPTDCACSCYAFNSNANDTSLARMTANLSDLQMCAFSNETNKGRFVVKDLAYTDATAFTTAVTGQKLLYPLATPIIIPLTSTVKVKTISGLNNIYSNTGDVSLEYFVNKADDIDKLINAEKSTESSDYHAYSTDEQVVGRWIDGKDIYEKTFTATFTNIAQSTPQNMADISGLGIADVISVSGSCKYDASTPTVQPTLCENIGGHFYCYVYPSGYLQFGQTMTSQTTGRTYDVKVTLRYTKTSSNTRSLNLSKGSSEEIPIEEKKEELKEFEEVKEVQDE